MTKTGWLAQIGIVLILASVLMAHVRLISDMRLLQQSIDETQKTAEWIASQFPQ